MNTTKKLLSIALVLVLLSIGIVSTSYSWYSHSNSDEGKGIHYEDSLELSIKTTNMQMSTYKCDNNGEVTDNTLVSGVNVPAETVQYYKTSIKNNGTDDVMADLETTNLLNNADFVIGTVDPTLNEKAFASRAVRSKTSDNKIRVYFKTNTAWQAFWKHGKDEDGYNTLDLNNEGSSSNNTTCEINIAYSISGTVEKKMMEVCSNADSNWSNTGTKVYYYDIPSNADYFFFFNKWYMKLADNDNRVWNCTIHITDLSPGKLYYLTGKSVNEAGSEKEKEYAVLSTDTNLVALNSYYKDVRLSLGGSVYADIGLKKDSDTDDEEFVPDYFGKNITYSIKSGSSTSVVSVNRDGLLTPLAAGSTIIQTRITGKFGDYRDIYTDVNIPTKIDQIPIIKNVRVPAGKTVDIYWYARNNSEDTTMTTDAIFLTL